MQKFILGAGAIMAMLAVILGAFGAHALESYLVENNRLETYKTAVNYQFYHALGLLAVGLFYTYRPVSLTEWAGLALLGGIVIFSGSLYALCFTGIRMLGAITPIGGVLFIVGWFCFFLSIWNMKGDG
ncbi:DUF423 domain-containing protein [Rapidithrix thailandica]|uniref:DUF423 domain-containing protein n=1 Tax=Rapidithrix thailandica TaxID=413964 RepID=A0AAW9S9J0_9BACT